jgi:hypothetical protein
LHVSYVKFLRRCKTYAGRPVSTPDVAVRNETKYRICAVPFRLCEEQIGIKNR